MRKTTRRLKEKLSEAESADLRLASKVAAINSFMEKSIRSINEKREALKREIDQTFDHVLGELDIVAKTHAEVAGELRGEDAPPLAIEHKPEEGSTVTQIMKHRETA